MAGVGPQVVQVLDFATARAPELQALHELAHHTAVNSVDENAKLLTQRNQRRRRANAFKSHQMPRRLRQPTAHVRDGDTTTAEEHITLAPRHVKSLSVMEVSVEERVAKARVKREQKPRCRKHRRRMHLLLDDHSWLKTTEAPTSCNDATTEDQGDDVVPLDTLKWLPTHLWHAKRMHMREQYGHVLAQHRQDKSVSAALTALRKCATLHDASYYGVLELYGLDALILEVLQLLVDPSGSEFDDEQLLTGSREGHSVLHHANQFPSGAIAPVSFQWRPLNGMERGDSDDAERPPAKRQLWLWIHPAAFMEAATAIASACQEVMSERDDLESIEILDRRGHLARFQLRGKAANSMVDKVLRAAPSPSVQMSEDDNTSDHEDGFSLSLIRTTTATDNLKRLRAELKGAANSERNVFSVLVQDPRLRFQSSQQYQPTSAMSLLQEPAVGQVDTKATILCPLSGLSLTSGVAEEPDSERILAQLESLLQWTTSPNATSSTNASATYPYVSLSSASPAQSSKDDYADVTMSEADESSNGRIVPCSELWSLTGRERISRLFQKDHEFNQRKQRGRETGFADQATGVPLMVVQQPGTFKHSGGWDLIMSPDHARLLLNALVFSGAMVIGQDEQEALTTIAHMPSFPRDFPDTASGREYWELLGDAQEAEHIKKPKAKRVPYEVLGVQCPFRPNWDVLFGDAPAEETVVSTLDDGDEDMVSSLSLCVLRSASYMAPFPFSRAIDLGSGGEEEGDEPTELIPVAVPTLIRVALSFPRRAALEPCSMLYVPTDTDLANFHNDPKWSGRQWDYSELELLGFVTSAVYDRPMGAFRGIAFCACEALQRLTLSQFGRRDKNTRLQLLALTRTPTSRQLRPVVIHIQV